MIDTHAHLDACAEPADELVARAREAGVERIVSVGSGIDSCRETLAIAARHEGVFAALGIHPHQAAEPDASRLDELRELLGRRARRRGRRDRPRLLPRLRAARPPARALRAAARARRRARQAGRRPHARRRRRDRRRARAVRRAPSSCTASRRPSCCRSRSSAATTSRSPATSPTRRPSELREAARAVPAERLLAETDSPYLAPQPRRGRPNEPANVVHTVAALAEARGRGPGRARPRRSTRTRARPSACA